MKAVCEVVKIEVKDIITTSTPALPNLPNLPTLDPSCNKLPGL